VTPAWSHLFPNTYTPEISYKDRKKHKIAIFERRCRYIINIHVPKQFLSMTLLAMSLSHMCPTGQLFFEATALETKSPETGQR